MILAIISLQVLTILFGYMLINEIYKQNLKLQEKVEQLQRGGK